LAARQRAAADEALDWLRKNNRWHPDAPVAVDVARGVDAWLHKVDGFQLNLGPYLLKSGRPTVLAVRRGALFQFELTPDQARGLQLKAGARHLLPYRLVIERWRAEPRVELSDFHIDHADALPPGGKITGSVRFRRRGPWGDTPHLRVIYYHGQLRVTRMHYLRPPPQEEEGSLTFTIGPLAPAHAPPARPLVLFADLASKMEEERIVESNTLAVLVQSAAGK
jgi:hypothetical protein